MRLLVTALVAALALALAGCSHDTELKESPEQIRSEQAAADAHNAGTTPSPGDDESPSTEGPVETTIPFVEGAERLFPGDCVDQPSNDAVDVHDIDCSKPHHAEVTARFDLGPRFGSVRPTDKELDDVLAADCSSAFESYVGHPPTADLIVGYFGPPLNGWSDPARRFAQCLAESPNEGNVLVGSVRKRT